MYHHKKLKKLSQKMQAFWDWDVFGNKLRRNVSDIHHVVRRIYIAVATVNALALLLYVIKPVLLQTRMLPVLRYDWCNMDEDPCFYFTYFLQAIEFTEVYIVNTGFDAFFISLITYSYCELQIIKYGFQNYQSDGKYPKTFSELIEHHNTVLRFEFFFISKAFK